MKRQYFFVLSIYGFGLYIGNLGEIGLGYISGTTVVIWLKLVLTITELGVIHGKKL